MRLKYLYFALIDPLGQFCARTKHFKGKHLQLGLGI
jgi:hypothetical protein